MENQQLRRYIVTLKKGVDYDGFYHDMETVTDNIPFIPNRAVAIPTWLPNRSRSTYYLLSDIEATLLKNDPRVLDVVIPIEDDPNVIIGPVEVQTSKFDRPSTGSIGGQGGYKNWGLLRSTFYNNIYGSGSTPSTSSYSYHLDGTGVDYVVCDTGIEPDHPEFQDANGVSRVQQINWLEEAGAYAGSGKTQSSLFYRDVNGHGTHVASTSVGKTFGWAKNARIYLMKINLGQADFESNGTTFTGYDLFSGLDIIQHWHENKPVDTVTGKKRPTIVNCSWVTSTFTGGVDPTGIVYKSVTKGIHRGTTWYGPGWTGTEAVVDSAAKMFSDYGANFVRLASGTNISNFSGIPIRFASMDAAMEDLIDAGVHVCIAMGNNNSYSTNDPNDISYNNHVELPMYVYPFHADALGYALPVAEGATVVEQSVQVGQPDLNWTTLLAVGDTILLNPELPDKVAFYTVTEITSNTKIKISPGYKSFGRSWPIVSATIRRPKKYYTHRGCSPCVSNAIMVSSGDAATKLLPGTSSTYVEQSATYSNRGPTTTVWAPGTNITAAWPRGVATTAVSTASSAPVYAYNENSTFKQRCISGTSMASPQVAGVVALYLQLNPDATVAQVKQFIINSSAKSMVYDTTATDYANLYSAWGSPNRFLYFPYANSQGLGADTTLTGEGGNANNLKIAPVAYTYDNWAIDYELSAAEKALGINIANFFYLSKANLGLQYKQYTWQTTLSDVFGLNRKPDTAGLEYWTKRCLKTEASYVQPGDAWTVGDYQSAVFKKAFCDLVDTSSGDDRVNFFGAGLRPQGGYWTNGDFIDRGLKP